MSKIKLVKAANILHLAGYSTASILKSIGFPKVESIKVTAIAVDEHLVSINIQNKSKEVKSSTAIDTKKMGIIPLLDYVESSVKHDGSGDWSIDRSKIFVKFSGGNVSSFFFGKADSGPETDKRIPLIHRISIPSDPEWPVPDFLIPSYPAPLT
tara:strand:- start:285 stop:746 length:462 start_codon:yes stop_codon:yes gene_type:complete